MPRLVVARFFGGDLAGLHRRGPKEVALSRLAEQLRLHGIRGRSVLDTCLATYETLLPMGDLVTSRDLSPSHVRAVFPLPQPERESLLRLAAERGWSVREVRQAALRAPRRMLSARPSRHEYERRVHDLARAARDLIRVVSDRSAMAGIEADVHARAFGEFARTIAALERALHRATPKRTAEGGSR